MRPVLRRFAALRTIAMLVLVGSASAGPVPVDGVQGRTDDTEAVQSTLPALSNSALGEGLAPGGVSKAASASGSDPGASTSALAAEIIKEADASAADMDPTHKAQRGGAQPTTKAATTGASSRNQAQAADDERSLRAMGKAVVHWLKESLPWLRDEKDDGGVDKHVRLSSTDWSTSPLEGGKAGRSAMDGAAHLPGATGQMPPGPGYTAGYGNAAPRTFADPEQNMVRMIASFVREVLEHPMTWLVVSLVVVGAIAMKKADRRPK